MNRSPREAGKPALQSEKWRRWDSNPRAVPAVLYAQAVADDLDLAGDRS